MFDARQELEIVEKSEISGLRRWRRVFYTLASVSVFVVGIALGEAWAYHKTCLALERDRVRIEKMHDDYVDAYREMYSLWQRQRDDMKLVTNWAEYVKARDDLVSTNKKMDPPNLSTLRRVKIDNFTQRNQEKKP